MKLLDATRDSLTEYAPDTQIMPVAEGDVFGCWELYKSFWGNDDDLMVVEHDIILHEDVIPQFEACPQPWCLFPFRYRPDTDFLRSSTGCARYRREFREKVTPEMIEAVPGSCNRCDGRTGCWAHMDGRIHHAGEEAGFTIHVHWPSVGHKTVMPGECRETVNV